jgi:hypothetical protein
MKNTKHGHMPLGYEVNISTMAISIHPDVLGVKSWIVDCLYIRGDGHPVHFHISADIYIYICMYKDIYILVDICIYIG